MSVQSQAPAGPWLFRGFRPASVLLAAGPLPDPGWLRTELDLEGVFVACADGGVRNLEPLGLKARLWMGDGDSLAGATVPGDAESRHFPIEKDETDLELVLGELGRRGQAPVALLGAIGARWDHTLANFHVAAAFRARAGRIALYGQGCRVRFVGPEPELLLAEPGYDTVSLVPLGGDACGVFTRGLQWDLTGETLSWQHARGVSNRLSGHEAIVEVRQGCVALFELAAGGH